MKKIAIPLMLLVIIMLVGCSKQNIFDVSEKIKLQGDYSESETYDFLDDEQPEFIPTAKLICEDSGKCIMIMEIDYELFADMLQTEFAKCNIDFDNFEKQPTEAQIECAKEVWQSLGMEITN